MSFTSNITVGVVRNCFFGSECLFCSICLCQLCCGRILF